MDLLNLLKGPDQLSDFQVSMALVKKDLVWSPMLEYEVCLLKHNLTTFKVKLGIVNTPHIQTVLSIDK